MEPRIGNGILVRKVVAQKAAMKLGLDPNQFLSVKSKAYVKPTAEEKAYYHSKRLTVFQGRLRSLFRYMLEQRIEEEAMRQCFNGNSNPIVCSGLSFKELMLKNRRIAERTFAEWSCRLGIKPLYDLSCFGDAYELRNTVYKKASDAFECQLHWNEKYKSYEVIESDDESGYPVSKIIMKMNCYGKDVYQRYCQVLRMLR